MPDNRLLPDDSAPIGESNAPASAHPQRVARVPGDGDLTGCLRRLGDCGADIERTCRHSRGRRERRGIARRHACGRAGDAREPDGDAGRDTIGAPEADRQRRAGLPGGTGHRTASRLPHHVGRGLGRASLVILAAGRPRAALCRIPPGALDGRHPDRDRDRHLPAPGLRRRVGALPGHLRGPIQCRDVAERDAPPERPGRPDHRRIHPARDRRLRRPVRRALRGQRVRQLLRRPRVVRPVRSDHARALGGYPPPHDHHAGRASHLRLLAGGGTARPRSSPTIPASSAPRSSSAATSSPASTREPRRPPGGRSTTTRRSSTPSRPWR